MSLEQFKEKMSKSKSYIVTELFTGAIPSELYKNNSMNIPATAERELRRICMGKFASEKDEKDFDALMELIRLKKPIYPLHPVIRPKDVVGITLENGAGQWTLSMNELRDFAAKEIFGIIETPYFTINSNADACIKSVYVYAERGGKVTSVYRQALGMQTIPAVSASYVNVIEDGNGRKVRINGNLTIPVLKIKPHCLKFVRPECND